MKRAGKLAYILISFTAFFATAAFASNTNKGTLQVQAPIMAGETQLPAGDYTVQWEGSGPDVELKIKQGRRVKAIVPAKVVPLDHALSEDAAVLGIDDDGRRKLREIRFSNKNFFLQVESQSASATKTPTPIPGLP
jgi:hypothetical protein